MPTQSTIEQVSANAKPDKARARALTQARNDSKALFDCLKAAGERDQDADVRAGLITAAKARLALVTEALKGL